MGWHDFRPNLVTDWHAINPQRLPQPVIGLNQRSYGVASLILYNDP